MRFYVLAKNEVHIHIKIIDVQKHSMPFLL